MTTQATGAAPRRLSADFWNFWFGQTISNLGASISMFAMPLLVYQLTGSALNLGLTMAFAMLPNLCFGLFIGAWVDRVDRKKLMVTANGRIQASYSAAMVAGPLLAGLLAAVIPIYDLLLLDVASFIVSAVLLWRIRRSFNADGPHASRASWPTSARG